MVADRGKGTSAAADSGGGIFAAGAGKLGAALEAVVDKVDG
jgi:hypothetical protein